MSLPCRWPAVRTPFRSTWPRVVARPVWPPYGDGRGSEPAPDRARAARADEPQDDRGELRGVRAHGGRARREGDAVAAAAVAVDDWRDGHRPSGRAARRRAALGLSV